MREDEAGVRSRRRRVAAAATPPPAAVRLARLVRSAASTPEPTSSPLFEGGLVIELGDARLMVGRGADVATVVTVLAMLRGGGR